MLKETDKTILEISVAFQYGSQEAFTRAFESCFGMTPAKYRKIQQGSIKYFTRINFMDYERKIKGDINIDKPDIINVDKIYISGYEYKTSLNNEEYFDEISGFYHDFGSNEYYMKIPNRIAPAFSYGISRNFHDDGQFSFIVGEAIKQPVERLGSGFVNLELPEVKYAEFKVNGPVGIAQNTWKYIYGIWLPNSNYERKEGPDFEVTDVCNSVYPNRMSMKIYIPIE